MTEITIFNLNEPDKIGLCFRWRKPDGLRYPSAVTIDCSAPPEALADALEELARKIREEIKR